MDRIYVAKGREILVTDDKIKQQYIGQINNIVNHYNDALGSKEGKDIIKEFVLGQSILPMDAQQIISRSMNAIIRISSKESAFYQEAIEIKRKYPGNDDNSYSKLSSLLVSILVGLGRDLENDWLINSSELVRSELFTDYLDMSAHLLSEGYKDAAAVIIGSSLEIHLRKLAIKHSIDLEFENHKNKIIPKKSIKLNSDLKTEGIYNELQRSQVEAWLKLRNNAAHGEYNEYDQSDVSLFIDGLRNFILNNPA